MHMIHKNHNTQTTTFMNDKRCDKALSNLTK